MKTRNSTWRQGSDKNLEGYMSPHIAYPLTATSKAIKDFALSVRLSKWRLISTAPSNQELELRIVEDGKISVLEFPCLRTNTGTWINVDLGAEIRFQAVEWRVWQRDKAPQPHHSQIKLGVGHAMLRHAKNLHAHRLRPLLSDAIQ